MLKISLSYVHVCTYLKVNILGGEGGGGWGGGGILSTPPLDSLAPK